MKYSSIVGETTFMAALHLTEGNTDTTWLIPEIADRIIPPYKYLGDDRWGLYKQSWATASHWRRIQEISLKKLREMFKLYI